MSDSSAFGFGKFIPGFDFLQSIGKSGTPSSGLPPFSHWVAPTVSIEEIEKRIEELKAVQFWLEQNGKALAATVQALEVQKMTLSTLKGMNVNLADMAQAFPFASASATAASAQNAGSNLSDWPMSAGVKTAAQSEPTQAHQAVPEPEARPQAHASADGGETQAAHMATAMQWWGALTQQFQHIAQQAMQDPAQQQAMLKATKMSTDFAKTAVKTASDMVRQAVAQTQATKPASAPAKKAAPSTKAAAAKKTAAKRGAAVKKSTSSDKKAPSAVSKVAGVVAKKSTVSKPRSR